jgi:hypothetical protein
MSDTASSLRCRFNLRHHRAGVFEKSSTCGREFDTASAARQEWRAYLLLKIPNLPTQGWLRCVKHALCCHRQTSGFGNRDEVT